MGLDFDQLFPNRFLKAGEFAGKDVTLKITGVAVETLKGDKGDQQKAILSFHGTPKQLVLNKTNGLCIKAMFGRDTGAWIGKRVTFWPAPIQYEDSDLAIRVRGSPDITAPIEFELKLPRKKAKKTTLIRTGQPAPRQATTQRAATPPPPAPAPTPEPPAESFDATTGEVFDGAPPFGEPPPDVDLPTL